MKTPILAAYCALDDKHSGMVTLETPAQGRFLAGTMRVHRNIWARWVTHFKFITFAH